MVANKRQQEPSPDGSWRQFGHAEAMSKFSSVFFFFLIFFFYFSAFKYFIQTRLNSVG